MRLYDAALRVLLCSDRRASKKPNKISVFQPVPVLEIRVFQMQRPVAARRPSTVRMYSKYFQELN